MAEPESASKPRVFISYSRRDSTFVDELIVSTESYGFEVVLDREDLFPGEAWEPRLRSFITDADTTLCVVSANWVGSDQCKKELSIALQQGRRVIPLLIEPVSPSLIPEELSRLQFIVFHGEGHSYAKGMVNVVNALRADIGWVREQTRLLDKAEEWVASQRASALLLRGAALERALAWANSRAPEHTRILPVVTEYVEASRKGQDDAERLAFARGFLCDRRARGYDCAGRRGRRGVLRVASARRGR